MWHILVVGAMRRVRRGPGLIFLVASIPRGTGGPSQLPTEGQPRPFPPKKPGPRGPGNACLGLSGHALPARGAALYRHLDDAVGAALVNQAAAVARRTHVADDAGIDATSGNRPALERFGLGITPHQGIRPHARLVVPDDAVHDDDRIGMRRWPARRHPLLDLAGLRIVAAESAHP